MDDDKETTSVDVSIASLVGPFRNIMSYFTHIRSAKSDTYQLEASMDFLRILHLRFSRWGATVKLSSEVDNLKDLYAAVQGQESVFTARAKLASMVNELEYISKITRGRNHAIATADDPMNSGALIQILRRLADSRQCKTKRTFRWYLLLQEIRHWSFRRQCKLSATKVNWIFHAEDRPTLDRPIYNLFPTICALEELIPGDSAISTSYCRGEARWLLPLAPLDSWQLHYLKLLGGKFDARLEKAIGWRKDGAGPTALQVNENEFIRENRSPWCVQGSSEQRRLGCSGTWFCWDQFSVSNPVCDGTRVELAIFASEV